MISIVIHGRITRDIDSRITQSGTASCSFGVVSNERAKKAGALVDIPTFIDCKAYGKTAEFLAAHFAKGKPVIICGRLTTETWQAKDGSGERSKIGCMVESVHFELSKSMEHQPSDGGNVPPVSKPSAKPFALDVGEEEVPF